MTRTSGGFRAVVVTAVVVLALAAVAAAQNSAATTRCHRALADATRAFVMSGLKHGMACVQEQMRGTEGTTRTQALYGLGSTAGDDEARLLFPVAAGKPAQVQVRWPDGTPQDLALTPGRYTLHQPPALPLTVATFAN